MRKIAFAYICFPPLFCAKKIGFVIAANKINMLAIGDEIKQTNDCITVVRFILVSFTHFPQKTSSLLPPPC